MARSRKSYVLCAMLMVLGTLTIGGCGGGGSTSTGSATFVLANSALTTRSAFSGVSIRGGTLGPVPIADIQSLTVTVTEIDVQSCDAAEAAEGAPEHETVLVDNSEFDPTSVEIEQGGTVRWEWTSNAPHTVTSGAAGDVDAGSLFNESGSTVGTVVELTFADLGTFPYFSNNDTDIAAGMAGVVNVVPEDDVDDDATQENGDGSEHGTQIKVFEGSFDVDLLDLTALSQVLTNAEIPAGHYCRIIVHIENPRLVLVADPNTVITNVHLTANGRLFIKSHFEIQGGEDQLILLDFADMHLVNAGSSGQYVLTPQLHADVDVSEADAEVEGEITSIDPDAKTFTVLTDDGDTFTVTVTDTTAIKSDDDSDDAGTDTGATVDLSFDALAVGQQVQVKGTFSPGNEVTSNEVDVDDASINTAV